MAPEVRVKRWVERVRDCASATERERFLGVSVTLAARLLRVSRARVQQLVKAGKLRVIDVRDERGVRIGHLVTMASINHRRRTVRPTKTQWRPEPKGRAVRKARRR